MIGTADVTLVKENEDGSAVYQFDFPPEALDALTRLGIITAIKAGIEEAKKLAPEYNPEFTDEIKALAEEAGFIIWSDEEWNIDNHVVDWAGPYDEELVKFYELTKYKVVNDIIELLMKLHDEAQGNHNIYKCAANAIKQEQLGQA